MTGGQSSPSSFATVHYLPLSHETCETLSHAGQHYPPHETVITVPYTIYTMLFANQHCVRNIMNYTPEGDVLIIDASASSAGTEAGPKLFKFFWSIKVVVDMNFLAELAGRFFWEYWT